MIKRVISAALVIIMLNLVSASFIFNSSNIQENYAPSSNLKGWINISFQNEAADNLVNLGAGGIKLIDLINLNSAQKTCVPQSCNESYSSTNPVNSKNFNFAYGEEKTLAFYLTGSGASVSSLSFSLKVSNDPLCLSPIEIDFFDDGKIDWKIKNTGEDYSCIYSTGMGCFNPSSSLSEVLIGIKPFCENITLLEGNKFMLGAWVKKGIGPASLKMSLYNASGKLRECNLPEPSASGGEISCSIDYFNNDVKDYYVCINANIDSDYATKTENTAPCGFYAIPGQQTDYNDYWIFAKSTKFENVGSILFNQQEYNSYNGRNLAADLSNYLLKYNGNCTLGCSIPMKIKAQGSVSLNISGIDLRYATSSGNQPALNKIYDASKTSGLVSSGFVILNLDNANLILPSSSGNQTIDLFLGSEKILSKNIIITGSAAIESIWPTIIAAGANTRFTAITAGNRTISSYSWDFGDGASQQTTTNYVTHQYSALGNYTLALKIKDASGNEATKEVMIIAGNPKDVLNSTLKKYRERVNNLTSQVSEYPAWYQTVLKNYLGLDSLEAALSEFEREFSLTSDEAVYLSMMSNLSSVNVPASIVKGSQKNYPILLSDDINFNYLSQLGAGEASSENLKSGILKWYSLSGLEASADYFPVYAQYDDRRETILSYFNLKIKPKASQSIDNYLVIGEKAVVNSESVEFDDATGIVFSSLEERNVEFVTGDVNPLKINVYLSPKFEQLDLSSVSISCNVNDVCEKDLGENVKNCREDCKPTWRIIFYIILMLFLAFVAYLGLQYWYRNRYEGHLFKNKNDIFNLVNFIDNALTKGLNEKEIRRNLSRVGWNNEQLDYAFKKIRGERIMPLEINLPKFEIKKGK